MKKHSRFFNVGIAILGISLGLGIWFFAMEEISFLEIASTCFKSVGITIFALCPLAFWALKTIIFRNEDTFELNLSYIGSQAKEMGFLGTVIGVMIMFSSLSVSLNNGDSNAIKQAIGGFSQAAISTAVGLIISSFCKHFKFLKLRDETKVPNDLNVHQDEGQNGGLHNEV